MPNKWENKNFLEALKNSLNGIKYVIKNEKNIKIELVFAILAILVSFILKINFTEMSIIALVIFLVLFAEFLNTTLENLVDLYTEEYNEKARIIKDISAGAVTLVSCASIIIGILIFLPKILIIIGV